MPLFTIIIPTYNRAEKLRRALESVETQTFKNFEVIVCDDGSTDDSKSVVVSFAERMKITYLWETNWGGPARPRNNGLKIAQGEWICFLDADDWWYPNKLAVMHDHIGEADVLYHDSDVYTEARGSHPTTMRGRQLGKPAFADMMIKGNPLINSSVCVRKIIIEHAGLFSEEKKLISVEDFDLWLRIARVTERFKHISKSLSGYWIGEENISGVLNNHFAAHDALLKKHQDYLAAADRAKAISFFSYLFGIRTLSKGLYKESRTFFHQSFGSRDIRVAVMSLIRIIDSYARQSFTLIRSLKR